MMMRIDRELEGAIANAETYEGAFALGMAALVSAVEDGFIKIALQLDALGKLSALERKHLERLGDEVMETAAAINQQTAMWAKVHKVDLSNLWGDGDGTDG